MAITAEDFRRHYESLSDEALLEIDPSELVEAARNCLAEEVARRGIVEKDPEESAGDAGSQAAPEVAAEEERICIVEYDYLDEAELALGLLEAAEIQASLESEPGAVRLMVPAPLAEQALHLLTAPLTDEELTAQAEAAGLEEEEFKAEEDPEA